LGEGYYWQESTVEYYRVKSNPIIVYLDHNVLCAMADNEPLYTKLSKTLNEVITLDTFIFPYSIVHIQELAEVGRHNGMTKEDRFKLVMPKLQFIKKISNSNKICHNDDYTNYFYRQRDPFEAYNTFTGVELSTVTTSTFMNFIPKTMIKSLQKSFNAGPHKLNNMNEYEAIMTINQGIQAFIIKCNNDKEFHKQYVEESKAIAIKMVTDNHSQCLSVINETINFITSKINSDNFDYSSKSLAVGEVEKLKKQKYELENSLSAQISQISDTCDKSLTVSDDGVSANVEIG